MLPSYLQGADHTVFYALREEWAQQGKRQKQAFGSPANRKECTTTAKGLLTKWQPHCSVDDAEKRSTTVNSFTELNPVKSPALAFAAKLSQNQLAEAELFALCQSTKCRKEDLEMAIRICRELGVSGDSLTCARERLKQLNQESAIDAEWMLSLAKNIYREAEPMSPAQLPPLLSPARTPGKKRKLEYTQMLPAQTSWLSGVWEGKSESENGSTEWTDTEISFNFKNSAADSANQKGKIKGHGVSMWRNMKIEFLLKGTFDLETKTLTLHKQHTGLFKTCLTYKCQISPGERVISGEYMKKNIGTSERARKGQPRCAGTSATVVGGTLTLRRKPDGKEMHARKDVLEQDWQKQRLLELLALDSDKFQQAIEEVDVGSLDPQAQAMVHAKAAVELEKQISLEQMHRNREAAEKRAEEEARAKREWKANSKTREEAERVAAAEKAKMRKDKENKKKQEHRERMLAKKAKREGRATSAKLRAASTALALAGNVKDNENAKKDTIRQLMREQMEAREANVRAEKEEREKVYVEAREMMKKAAEERAAVEAAEQAEREAEKKVRDEAFAKAAAEEQIKLEQAAYAKVLAMMAVQKERLRKQHQNPAVRRTEQIAAQNKAAEEEREREARDDAAKQKEHALQHALQEMELVAKEQEERFQQLHQHQAEVAANEKVAVAVAVEEQIVAEGVVPKEEISAKAEEALGFDASLASMPSRMEEEPQEEFDSMFGVEDAGDGDQSMMKPRTVAVVADAEELQTVVMTESPKPEVDEAEQEPVVEAEKQLEEEKELLGFAVEDDALAAPMTEAKPEEEEVRPISARRGSASLTPLEAGGESDEDQEQPEVAQVTEAPAERSLEPFVADGDAMAEELARLAQPKPTQPSPKQAPPKQQQQPPEEDTPTPKQKGQRRSSVKVKEMLNGYTEAKKAKVRAKEIQEEARALAVAERPIDATADAMAIEKLQARFIMNAMAADSADQAGATKQRSFGMVTKDDLRADWQQRGRDLSNHAIGGELDKRWRELDPMGAGVVHLRRVALSEGLGPEFARFEARQVRMEAEHYKKLKEQMVQEGMASGKELFPGHGITFAEERLVRVDRAEAERAELEADLESQISGQHKLRMEVMRGSVTDVGMLGAATAHAKSNAGKKRAVTRVRTQVAPDFATRIRKSKELLLSCWLGEVSAVRLHLRAGADPDFEEADGSTPLQRASWQGFSEVVRQLLIAGADANRRSGDDDTALMTAVFRRQERTVQLLLDYDGDPALHNGRGETAVMWACKAGHAEGLVLVLDALAKGTQAKNDKGEVVVEEEEEEEEHGEETSEERKERKTLEALRSQLLRVDRSRRTALHMACTAGEFECAHLLLDRATVVDGAFSQHLLNNGARAVPKTMLAASGVSNEVVLEEAEAAAAHAVVLELLHACDQHQTTALMEACSAGSARCTSLLLRTVVLIMSDGVEAEAGPTPAAFVNTRNHKGDTALMWACEHGHDECARLLLDSGAIINAANSAGSTALVWACCAGHADTVRLLLSRGASWVVTPSGDTPLMWASWSGHYKCVDALLTTGSPPAAAASIDEQNNDGASALLLACQRGHARCVDMLLSHGADRTLTLVSTPRLGSMAIDAAALSAHQGHTECLVRLLKYSSDPTGEDQKTLREYLTAAVGEAVAAQMQAGMMEPDPPTPRAEDGAAQGDSGQGDAEEQVFEDEGDEWVAFKQPFWSGQQQGRHTVICVACFSSANAVGFVRCSNGHAMCMGCMDEADDGTKLEDGQSTVQCVDCEMAMALATSAPSPAPSPVPSQRRKFSVTVNGVKAEEAMLIGAYLVQVNEIDTRGALLEEVAEAFGKADGGYHLRFRRTAGGGGKDGDIKM
jgi:ankyrin repeat protein